MTANGHSPRGGTAARVDAGPGQPRVANCRVRVLYFAMLREQARREEETVETAATTPSGLYEELRRRHGFSLGPPALKVAIDDEFAAWDAPLREGARVAFVPPFSGG